MSDCTVLALYGVGSGSPPDFGAFYDWAMEQFLVSGGEPSHGGVAALGKPAKFEQFDAFQRKLKRVGFDRVGDLWLVRLTPPKLAPSWDWTVIAGASADLSMGCFIQPAEEGNLSEAADSLVRLLRPRYGGIFEYPRLRRPDLYIVGLIGSVRPESYDERLSIARWGDAIDERKFDEGIVRAVYSTNYLNESHLEQFVDGKPFGEWVAADAARGVIRSVAPRLWAWEVGPGDIGPVQEGLQAAGMVFDWRRHLR